MTSLAATSVSIKTISCLPSWSLLRSQNISSYYILLKQSATRTTFVLLFFFFCSSLFSFYRKIWLSFLKNIMTQLPLSRMPTHMLTVRRKWYSDNFGSVARLYTHTMATEESFPVKVYIYDISKGLARALSQGFIGKCCTNADENSVDLGLAVSKTKQSHNH